MNDTVDRIIMPDSNNAVETMALMNNNNWMNNPFMYLIWLAFFGNNGFGGFGGNGQGIQNSEIMSQINALRSQIAENQNTNGLQAAIGSNHEALHGINNGLGLGFANTASNINNASMANVLSQKDIQAQLAGSSSDIIASILGQTNDIQAQIAANNAASALQACQNNSSILSRIDAQTNAVESQLAQMSYALATGKGEIVNQNDRNTNAILQGQLAQTQTIVNTLNNHWQEELAQKYQDAKLELSQLNQNATLIAALKPTTTA